MRLLDILQSLIMVIPLSSLFVITDCQEWSYETENYRDYYYCRSLSQYVNSYYDCPPLQTPQKSKPTRNYRQNQIALDQSASNQFSYVPYKESQTYNYNYSPQRYQSQNYYYQPTSNYYGGYQYPQNPPQQQQQPQPQHVYSNYNYRYPSNYNYNYIPRYGERESGHYNFQNYFSPSPSFNLRLPSMNHINIPPLPPPPPVHLMLPPLTPDLPLMLLLKSLAGKTTKGIATVAAVRYASNYG